MLPPDVPALICRGATIIPKQDEVIDVPDVPFYSQLVFHEIVQRVEVHVGKELADEVADGQPPRGDCAILGNLI